MDRDIHPETGARLTRDIRPMLVRMNGCATTETVMMPGWYPDDDGDAVFEGSDLDILIAAQNRILQAHPESTFRSRYLFGRRQRGLDDADQA